MRATILQSVFPQDTNSLGTLFAGTLVGWMDKAAAYAAMRRVGGPVVTRAMLPIELLQEGESGKDADTSLPVGLSGLIGHSLAEIERLVINETIRHYGGSVPKAARILEVSPSTLYRKMEHWRNTR